MCTHTQKTLDMIDQDFRKFSYQLKKETIITYEHGHTHAGEVWEKQMRRKRKGVENWIESTPEQLFRSHIN